MSAETPSPKGPTIEQDLTELGIMVVNLARIGLLKVAIKFSGNEAPASKKTPAIPIQPEAKHDDLEKAPEKFSDRVLNDCQNLFDSAIRQQLDSSKSFIVPAEENDFTSEYVAISNPTGGILYVYRPSLANEADAQFPFWIRQEVVANDVETDLPTLYSREFLIDSLGYLQTVELLPGKRQVYRPLEAHEALPYYQALAEPKLHHIVPVTELSANAE